MSLLNCRGDALDTLPHPYPRAFPVAAGKPTPVEALANFFDHGHHGWTVESGDASLTLG